MKGLVNLTMMLSKLLIWLIRSLGWLFVGFGPLVRFVLKPFGWLLNPILMRLQDPAVRRSAERRRHAEHLATTLLHELARLGFIRRERGKVVARVQFDPPLLLTREELWCPIDLVRLPHMITTERITTEEVMKSLHDRLNIDVRWDKLSNGKLCYVLRMAGATYPEVIPIQSLEMPKDAGPLAFPLGIDGEGKHQIIDLAKLPHLLIIGPTGKGKSTLVHTILTTWVTRNGPDDIEIWLADHKGGAELNRYAVLMGEKGRPGIIRRFSYKPEDTIAMLQAAQKEMDRRLEVLRSNDCSDLDDYTRQTGQYMKRIAIVIDEIFHLMLNKEAYDPQPGKKISIKDWGEQLFAKIASAGRAPGVHLIIATQKTGKDVLTGLITANFESRVIFGLVDMYQSIYVLGSTDAVGMPKGRVIFRGEADRQTEIQTPLITAQQTRLLLDRVSRYGPDGGLGRADHLKRFVQDAQLLLQVSCDLFAGEFAYKKLYQAPGVQGVLSRQRVEELAGRLEKDGVLEPARGKTPRRVARGYYGMPQLLESRYLEGANEVHNQPEVRPDVLPEASESARAATNNAACGPPDENAAQPHSDEENECGPPDEHAARSPTKNAPTSLEDVIAQVKQAIASASLALGSEAPGPPIAHPPGRRKRRTLQNPPIATAKTDR